MSSWRQQAVIDAPVEAVWRLVGDPKSYPEWAGNVIEVTGLATVDEGTTYTQTNKFVVGKMTTTFQIDELEELREIKLRCLQSGYYSRWVLTEAQEATFADVEIGMEPKNLGARAVDATIGKRWYRGITERAIDGLREFAGREPADRS